MLVATPGRLIDHLERGRIDFSRLEMLVLDEADRMLDMGFIDDVETIAAATPASRQTLLFSATLDGAIGKPGRAPAEGPEAHPDRRATSHARRTSSSACTSPTTWRTRTACCDTCSPTSIVKQAIVFTATKRDADMLAEDLSAPGPLRRRPARRHEPGRSATAP